jgi:hypothetical protein
MRSKEDNLAKFGEVWESLVKSLTAATRVDFPGLFQTSLDF